MWKMHASSPIAQVASDLSRVLQGAERNVFKAGVYTIIKPSWSLPVQPKLQAVHRVIGSAALVFGTACNEATLPPTGRMALPAS